MPPFHRQVTRPPKVPFDPLITVRLERTRTKNAQFVSFLGASGFRKVPARHHDVAARRRRALVQFAGWAFVFFASWVLVESARAFSIF